MQYLEWAVSIAFIIAGLWFAVQAFQALGTECIPADIAGQRVEIVKSNDPEKFRSALRFQAGTSLGCLVVGAGMLNLKLAGW